MKPAKAPRNIERLAGLAALLIAAFGASGCSVDSAKSHYVLAEKLWADGRYQAAVLEFNRVVKKDPQGKLGARALLRAATTEAVFLKDPRSALEKFRQYVRIAQSTAEVLTVERRIGDILYEDLARYQEVLAHYEPMVERAGDDPDKPLYLYRIGRSYFYLWRFEQAIGVYEKILKVYPASPWAERAAFEIGLSYFTSGGHRSGDEKANESDRYRKAIVSYEAFLKKYPRSEWAPRARFGIAACHEELDHLEVAYKQYQELLDSYPSPKVIRIKLERIRQRLAQRGTDNNKTN